MKLLHSEDGKTLRDDEINALAGAHSALSRAICGALARLSYAACLVDRDGHIIWFNEAAAGLSIFGEGIGISNERIVFSSAALTWDFETCLSALNFSGQNLLSYGGNGWALTKIRAAGNHRSLYIITASPPADMFQRLQEAFDLTPSEADIAVALIAGHSAKQIATIRDRSIETVRAQIKIVLQKTQMKRQGDLCRLRSRGGVRPIHFSVNK